MADRLVHLAEAVSGGGVVDQLLDQAFGGAGHRQEPLGRVVGVVEGPAVVGHPSGVAAGIVKAIGDGAVAGAADLGVGLRAQETERVVVERARLGVRAGQRDRY